MNEFENPQWEEEEVEIEAIGIEVDVQPIELYKVLKIANAVSGGGEAKFAIAEGYVAVNGEIELRKRRKLYDGDLVEFNQEYYLIICDAPVTEVIAKPKAAPAPKQKPAGKNRADKSTGDKSNAKKTAASAKKTKPAKTDHKQESPQKSSGGRNAIKFF